ncbi:hypothetical protein N8751_00890 [bacterium]|nr:hypothetical protein [bacterium]
MDNIQKSALFKSKINNTQYYRNSFPSIDDLVKIKILDIQEVGIEALLIEFNLKCFLSFQDASNSRKLYRIKKQYKINKTYTAKVTCVDEIKKYVDVSTRNVFDEEKTLFEDNISNYEKLFNAIIKSYIYQTGKDNINDILDKTIYKLNLTSMEKYVKNFNRDSSYFKHKFDDLSDILDYDILIQEIGAYLPKPLFNIESTIRINSTAIDASKDIINAVKLINTKLNTNYKFLKTPYFKHIARHIIHKNIESDANNFKKKLANIIKDIDIDYLYIISEDTSVVEI